MRLSAAFVVLLLTAGLLAMEEDLRQDKVREFSEVSTLDQSPGPTANVALADLDADGDLDIVLAKGRHDGGVDRLLLNDGQGLFTSRDLGTHDDSSYSATPADVDGDGDLDIVVSNDLDRGRVYLNDGRATFSLGSEWGDADWPTRNATIADLNGDGFPDIVVANRSPQEGRRSRTCLNDGRGRFESCVELNIGPATSLAAADLDRDGDIDLVAPNRDGGPSVLLYSNGRGEFDRMVPFGPDTMAARAVAAGDLNGDGWPDVVIGDERISTFVYLNDGRGGLRSGLRLTFDDLPTPYSLGLADLNGDGTSDIVIGYGTTTGDRSSVLFNDGSGLTFRHVRFGDKTSSVYGIAIGDVNGDGHADIVAARNTQPTLVFFNRAGLGVDTVVASSHLETPILINKALFEPRPFNPRQPLLGSWHGQAKNFLGQLSDLDLALDRLTAGPRTIGSAIESGYGVAYCQGGLRLQEAVSDRVIRLAYRRLRGDCPDVTIELSLLTDHQVRAESWQEGREQNRTIAILNRKR